MKQIAYFSIMKNFLLSGCTLLFAMVSFAQIKKDPNTSLSLEQYWKNQQKSDGSLHPSLNFSKKKAPAQELNIADILPLQNEADIKNTMPVLYPDSDYVFNMPGTHAFDPTKVKGGVFFVTESPVNRNCYQRPALVEIKSREDYFKIQQKDYTITNLVQVRK